jgi:hypothetical protein
MQKLITIACAALMLALTAFKPIKGLDEVIAALNSGNATELAKYVDDNIEIGLPDKTDTYSKAQAVMIFKDFFANNPVKSFELKHKGDSGGKLFCIGVLHTRSGDYRTQVFMNSKNGRQLVKVISFQPA